MEWNGRHSTPAGEEEWPSPAGEAEEARLPPRGKRVSGAQWNELIFTFNTSLKTTKYAKTAFLIKQEENQIENLCGLRYRFRWYNVSRNRAD